ncbi:LysR family transcriptional regulator [Paracoccus aminophilus]|uniref:Transcriptional regulator, LysR family n=1 Tax=Paracoccus aminophilus JCM 7686 TaxID=1367847 RepID=S5XZF7_PARAH|nr:LysR family transcriptional regulator [Paracoccus aminophilus]AGT08835.1 transcriptional regulator, LysR family [Paracoccus aminophilus JCM 7686]
MSLDLRHMRAFAALGRELHYRRASESLRIAQPALTKTIQQLEEHIGAPLLVRSTRRVELTEAGRVFLEGISSVTAQIDLAVERARKAARGVRGELRLAYTDFAINGGLPHFLREFNVVHPELYLDLTFMPTIHQHEAILQRHIDVGFLYGVWDQPQTSSLTFDENEYVVILPDKHPLAARDALTLRDLRAEKFVFGTGDSWIIFRKQVFAECRARGFFPDISLEATSSDGIFGLVLAGAGVAIYSSCIGDIPRPGLVTRKLVDMQDKLPITAVWERGNTSAEVLTFLKFLRQSRPLRTAGRS